LVISPITIDEINNAPDEIKTEIFDFMKTLNITKLPDLPETVDFANDYIKEGILSNTQFEDLTHIAYASTFKCEILISWNRNHLAKDTTQKKLNEYNKKHQTFSVIIITPETFLTENKNGRY
jgi:predicted nucleic acid-binding protein